MRTIKATKSRELRYYFALTLRWLWFLLLCMLLGGGGAYVLSKRQAPVYRATVLLIVDQRAAGQDPYSSLLASDQLVTTYIGLINQPIVMQKAVTQLPGVSTISLASRTQASAQSNTQIIVIQVDDSSADRAALSANAVANAFIDVLRQNSIVDATSAMLQLDQEIVSDSTQIDLLTRQISALTKNDPRVQSLQQLLDSAITRRTNVQAERNQLIVQSVNDKNTIRIFQPAMPPGSPDHPRPLYNGLVGAVLGLVLALCFVVLSEFLDDRIRTVEQFERIPHLTILGTLPQQKTKGVLLSTEENNSFLVEALRILRTNLQFVSIKSTRSIAVVSPLPDEGKTTLAINLALSLAQSSKRVLLIDADLRKPAVHTRLSLSNSTGLSLALSGHRHDRFFQQSPTVSNLFILTSGPQPPNPTELLESDKLYKLLQSVLVSGIGPRNIDVIVIDTPPALHFADASVIAAAVDGVVLVARAGMTRESTLLQTAAALKRVNACILGVVVSGVKKSSRIAYQSEYEGHQDGQQERLIEAGAPEEPMEEDKTALSKAPAVRSTKEPPGDTENTVPEKRAVGGGSPLSDEQDSGLHSIDDLGGEQNVPTVRLPKFSMPVKDGDDVV